MTDRTYYHVDRGPGTRYVLSKSKSRSKDITKRGYYDELAVVKSLKQLIHMAKVLDRRAQAAVARYAKEHPGEMEGSK